MEKSTLEFNLSDFDLEMLFGDNQPVMEEKQPEEESAFVVLTKKLLAQAEKDLEYWESKTFKRSAGSVYVGSELDGKNVTFNYINNKRIENGIRNSKEDIKIYKKDLGIQ